MSIGFQHPTKGFVLFLLSISAYLITQQLFSRHGLLGSYYANSQWKGSPQFTQIDPEISDAILRKHRPSFSDNRFSIEWRGFLAISRRGLYTFATRSDDGSWLFIDDQLVVDNGGNHGLKEARGQIQLEQGIHEIRIKYFQAGGYYRMEAVWSTGNEPLELIPSRVLLPSPLSFRRYQTENITGTVLFSVTVATGAIWLLFVFYSIGLGRLKHFLARPLPVVHHLWLIIKASSWSPLLFLLLLVLIFFYDVVFSGKTLLTTNLTPSTTPTGAYNYSGHRVATVPVMDPFASAWEHEPATHLTSLLYHRGIIPLWDPHTALGTPLNADMISTVFFPLSFLLYLTPQAAMWDSYLILRVLLAGIFMYLFLKRLQEMDALSAVLGAVAYMFCGHLMLHINIVFIHAAMLLPALMYTTEKLHREPGMKWAVLNGGMVGLLILGGHPEPSFFAIFFATGYYGLQCLLNFHTPTHLFLRRLLFLACSYGIGLALCAIMVLPFLEFVQNSYLGRHDPNQLVGLWSLPPKDIILLALPYFFGPIHRSWDGVVWDFQPGYLGFVVVLLVVLAAVEGLSFRRTYLFFTLIVTFFLVHGYNLIGIAHDFIGRLPFFNVSHFTRYFPPELAFSTAILMSAQIHRIREGKYRRWRLISVVLLSWLLIGLLWKFKYAQMVGVHGGTLILTETLQQTLPALVSGGLILVGLSLVSLKILSHKGLTILIGLCLIGELFVLMPHDHIDRYEPFAEPPFVQFLKSDPGTFRVYALDGYLYPNVPSAYELNSIGFVNGLINKRFWTFAAALIDKDLHTNWFFTGGLPVGEIRNVDNRFFNLFNLKYIITDKQGAPPYFHLDSSVYPMGGGAVPASPLVPGTSIGQTFTASGDLCAIGLFFGTYQRANTGTVLFTLKESPTSKAILFTTRINMVEIQDNAFHIVSFPPLPNSEGKTFYFELTAPEATRNNTVTLWTNQLDLYPPGQLYLNGQPAPGDSGFKVYSFASHASFEKIYDEEVKIYQNHVAFPRAFIAHEAEVISDLEKVLERLKDERFDIRHRVILEKEPSSLADLKSQVANLNLRSEIAEVIRYEPTRVTIQAKMEQPGFLVLSDPFYPGWKAYVNGKETEIFLTDYCLRSVFLNSGDYEVVFRYEPASYKSGAWLTLIGLGILAATFSSIGVFGTLSKYKV